MTQTVTPLLFSPPFLPFPHNESPPSMAYFTDEELQGVFELFFGTEAEQAVVESMPKGQRRALPKSNTWEVALSSYGPAEWEGFVPHSTGGV